MHLIGQGVAKQIFKLLQLSSSKKSPSAKRSVYAPTKEKLVSNKTTANSWPFTFDIDKDDLLDIGEYIDHSRAYTPSSFNSPWTNFIKDDSKMRAVDWINFLFHMLPTVFIPCITHQRTRQALVQLPTALKLASQHCISFEDLAIIKKKNLKSWNEFLLAEIKAKRLTNAIFKHVMHYISHIPLMIQRLGPLYSYSTRSLERSFGIMKRSIKAKVKVGKKNAGNVLVLLAIRSYLRQLPWSPEEELNLFVTRPRDDGACMNHLSGSLDDPQLWAPFKRFNLVDSGMIEGEVSAASVHKALVRFCGRVSGYTASIALDDFDIITAGWGWTSGDHVYGPLASRNFLNEFRHGEPLRIHIPSQM
ncbi:hypothetical protein G6F56_010315 [Rhizopus delemar]|nr:hypothetical protein G6F56_010315 [Rhizopus delemar]